MGNDNQGMGGAGSPADASCSPIEQEAPGWRIGVTADVTLDPRDAEIQRLRAALAEANGALKREIESRARSETMHQAGDLGASAAIDGIPGFVAILAPDGSVEAVNRQIMEYCGASLDGLRNWGSNGIVHEIDLQRISVLFTDAISSGTPYDHELRLRRFDGVYRWFSNRGVPIRDASGRIARWYVLLTDIDDRKRAEDALAAGERGLQLIVDATPALIWSAAPDGRTTSVNQHFVDYVGSTYEQLEDAGWRVAIHPNDHPALDAVWDGLRATGTAGQAEARLRRHDGVYRWFLMRTNPLFDENGNVIRWYGVNTDIEDRKCAEQAVAASERHLRETINAIPALAWCNRTDGSNEFLNQRWHDYTGLLPEEANGWGWQVALHPDDLPGLLTQWTHMLASGEPGELEARLRRHDGVYRWFLFRCDPLRDEAGNIVKWYGTNTDIEDLKQVEAELRRAYDSVANAQRLSHTGSFVTDIVVDEHHWSDEAYRIFDFDPGIRVTAQKIRNFVHPEDVETFDSVIERAVTGIAVDFIFRIVTPCGALKHVHGLAHVVEEVAGRPLLVGALQDVTQRKAAEDALQRSEAVLAQGEEVSETGSFLWKAATAEIQASAQLYRICGFEPGSRVTLALINDRLHPDDRALAAKLTQEARAGLDIEYEPRLLMPDGSVRYLHYVARRIRDSDGRIVELMGTVQDITGRKLAEQEHDRVRSELTHAARAMSLGVLTASLAHEVNQPLAGIITNANTCLRMLASDPPNVKGALETARRTIRDGNRASEVVTRLRTLFSKKDFVTETVDLNDAAHEVIALSAHELQRHQVAVLTEFEGGSLEVLGDRVQIQQVILNLLLNACDAVKGVESGPRSIAVTTIDDGAGSGRLTVRDTGVGIAPGSLSKLFDAFYTTKSDGMGIGLSVSRSIIDRHHGALWALPNDGPGASFSFSIPRTASAAIAGTPRAPQ